MPHTTLISCTDAQEQLNHPNTLFIDCRFDLMRPEHGYELYQQGHLPNAIYANLDRDLSSSITPNTGRHPLPNIEALVKIFSAWGIDNITQVIVYDDNIGMFASRLWWLLRWLGHDRVAVLDGGYQAWKEAGLPLTSHAPQIEPSQFQVELQKGWVIETNEIINKQTEGFLLLDARAPERFRGEVEPIDPVAGHIPLAVNYPLTYNIDNGRFKTATELNMQLTIVLQQHDADKIIHYCGSGVSACHNILAMEHAGLHGSKLYPGSWSEWILDPARSVETA